MAAKLNFDPADSASQGYTLRLLQATLNASLDGILVVDHRSSKVQQYNTQFLKLWRIPNEIATAADDGHLLQYAVEQLSDPSQFMNLVSELYKEPHRPSFDVLLFKDGRIFERHSEALVINNSVEGRVWYFRDVTEKLRREAQLIQSSKLASLGEMAGSLAHEINNPLAVVIGKTSVLRQKIESGKATLESAVSELTKIEVMAERIAKIVRGLRTLSRDNASDPLEPIELKSIVMDTVELCHERLRSANIDLKIIDPPDVQVSCRPAQLVQVLMNLVGNAIDAVESLAERWIKLDFTITADGIQLAVTDSGGGIDPNVVAKMMQPFFTTKPSGRGTGLGLSITREIILKHGGMFEYNADFPNTQFLITLPIFSAEARSNVA